jgi:hypothetical protein
MEIVELVTTQGQLVAMEHEKDLYLLRLDNATHES